MSNTVHVKNISSQTSEKEVRDFFSFCGKISSLDVTPSSEGADAPKSASVTFEKETAAKTALLLDNTQLGSAQVQVTSQTASGDVSSSKALEDDDEMGADDKPRTRIIAEYLAHGYVISDKAIQQAIDLDQKHGIYSRFQKALTDFDSKYKVSDKAQAADSQYKVSERANNAWVGLGSYFEKALDTPTGHKLRNFYSTGNKQVLDVHNEARHLADLKAGKTTTGSKAEEMGLEKVGETERTKCNCNADAGTCACESGNCACSSCSKNPEAEKSALPTSTT